MAGHSGEASFSFSIPVSLSLSVAQPARLVGRRGEEGSAAASVELHRLDNSRCTLRGGKDDDDDAFQRHELCKIPCVENLFGVGRIIAVFVKAGFGVEEVEERLGVRMELC